MRGWKTKAFVVALALCAPAIASAGWQDEATSFDQSRLARMDEARAKAMSEAGDIPAAREALGAPASGRSVAGSYRCRTIKPSARRRKPFSGVRLNASRKSTADPWYYFIANISPSKTSQWRWN